MSDSKRTQSSWMKKLGSRYNIPKPTSGVNSSFQSLTPTITPANTPSPSRTSPFLQSIKDGFATSLGFNLGSRTVDAILGSRTTIVEHRHTQFDSANCASIIQQYQQSMLSSPTISSELKIAFDKCNEIKL